MQACQSEKTHHCLSFIPRGPHSPSSAEASTKGNQQHNSSDGQEAEQGCPGPGRWFLQHHLPKHAGGVWVFGPRLPKRAWAMHMFPVVRGLAG